MTNNSDKRKNEQVVWPKDLAEGLEKTPRNRKRVNTPYMKRDGENKASRSYDGSLDILINFFNLCDLKGAIEALEPSTSEIRDVPNSSKTYSKFFEGLFFPASQIKRNSYMQASLLSDDPKISIRNRRFPILFAKNQNELDEAAKLALRLTPLIKQVIDNYAKIRSLTDYQKVNLTLRDMKGKRGDIQKLMKCQSELKSLNLNPRSMSIWKNARYNIARLWNWKLNGEEESTFNYPTVENTRQKLADKELTVIDLYEEASLDVCFPKKTFSISNGVKLHYRNRWNEITLLCQNCARPVLKRSLDNCSNVPSSNCSSECSKSLNKKSNNYL